ncbi:hypothetical protein ABE096_12475 [Robertmurraya massiliosenegalensis]
MAEAFVYMYVVGAGTAGGVATVVFLAWKVYQKSNNKKPKQKKVGY